MIQAVPYLRIYFPDYFSYFYYKEEFDGFKDK